MTVKCYVVCHDGGSEGYSGPIVACDREDTAISVASLMSATERYVVFAVPAFGTLVEPWFNLKPVWPEGRK